MRSLRHRIARGRLRRCGAALVLLQEIGHTLRRLRTPRDPVIDPGHVEAEPFLATGGDRVEEPYTLDVLTVTRAARIGHDHMIEGPLDRAAARQPNDHHTLYPALKR